ncbi:universal stress protein [Actinoplanes rectilineatus]
MLLGSVSRHLARHCPCTVAIVHSLTGTAPTERRRS